MRRWSWGSADAGDVGQDGTGVEVRHGMLLAYHLVQAELRPREGLGVVIGGTPMSADENLSVLLAFRLASVTGMWTHAVSL